MDRCEDVEPHPTSGRVYVVCTNNTDRGKVGKEGAVEPNPRTNNRDGHVIEITEAGNDAAATSFGWSILLLCGDPATNTSTYFAGFPADQVSPISCPDNVTFDSAGNMWLATDGAPGVIGYGDGLFKVPLEGPQRGRVQQFLSVPGRGRDLRTGGARRGRHGLRGRPAPRRERDLGPAALVLPRLRGAGLAGRRPVGRTPAQRRPGLEGLRSGAG